MEEENVEIVEKGERRQRSIDSALMNLARHKGDESFRGSKDVLVEKDRQVIDHEHMPGLHLAARIRAVWGHAW
jgi:uncharacterized FlgJ-related protein